MGDLSSERFQTGNHARVFVTSPDGSERTLGVGTGVLGKGTSVSASTSTGARPLHVLGDAEPAGIVDGAHTYSVRLSMLRLRTDDAAKLIEAGPVNIEIIDRFNNNLVQVAEGCRLSDGSLNVPANQPITQELSFIALRIK